MLPSSRASCLCKLKQFLRKFRGRFEERQIFQNLRFTILAETLLSEVMAQTHPLRNHSAACGNYKLTDSVLTGE